MALGTFVAGRYASSLDPPGATGATDLGIMERGYTLSVSWSKKLITETDAFGDSVLDGIYRGGNCHLQATSKEWKTGPLIAAFPYITYTPTGATYLGPGIVGRLDSDVAGILVMTATAGTPAALAPASITAPYTIIAENFDIQLLFDSDERKVPLRFRLLPYSDSGTIKWLTAT